MTTLPRRPTATLLSSLTAVVLLLGACQASPEEAAPPPEVAPTTVAPQASETPTPEPSEATPEIRTRVAPAKPDLKSYQQGELTEGMCAVLDPRVAPKKNGEFKGFGAGSASLNGWPAMDGCSISYDKGYVAVNWSAIEVTEEDWAWYQSAGRPEGTKDSTLSQGAWSDEQGGVTFYGGGRIMTLWHLRYREPQAVKALAEEMIKVAGQMKNHPEHITRPECEPATKAAVEILGAEPTVIRQSIARGIDQKYLSPQCGWATDSATVSVGAFGEASDENTKYFMETMPDKKPVKGIGTKAIAGADAGILFFETKAGWVVRVHVSDADVTEKQLVTLAKSMSKAYK